MTKSKNTQVQSPSTPVVETVPDQHEAIKAATTAVVANWRKVEGAVSRFLDSNVETIALAYSTGYVVPTNVKADVPDGSVSQADYARLFTSSHSHFPSVSTTTLKRWRTMGVVLSLVGGDVKHDLYKAVKASKTNDAVREAVLASGATVESVESAVLALKADKGRKSLESGTTPATGEGDETDTRTAQVPSFEGQHGKAVQVLVAAANALEYASLTPAERESLDEALAVFASKRDAWHEENAVAETA